jgi:dextranase
MKQILTIVLFFLLLSASSCKCAERGQVVEIPDNVALPEFVNLNVKTDKSCYRPGEEVYFTINSSVLPTGTKVRYKHLNNTLFEQEINSDNWTWKAPNEDFTGYIAEIYKRSDNSETVYAVIGIDVSSDWKVYPRYGFLSHFSTADQSSVKTVLSYLNRLHINGLQFYDWHNKHHKPLPISGSFPAENWRDIGNREISLNTVKSYINEAHKYNMKAMFYNLVYGAWNYAEKDGVRKEWYMYTDNTHTNIDLFSLSTPFISNLYLLDPGNSEWQEYMKSEVSTVYRFLDFDGYHMDQLGERGKRYRYDGSVLDIAASYKSYINSIDDINPEKYNVMNAVSQFGQQSIASSSADFLYSEIWSPWDSYNDLASVIKQNNIMSNDSKKTVLAAYVNYDLGDNKGFFNTPSVLMTDAVIFAFGGSHLELGEHMLCKEYFPNNNLSMNEDLTKSLVWYYDFMVAYQNLLRDKGEFNAPNLRCTDGKISLSHWPASCGSVAWFGKKTDTRQVIHLLNFSSSTTMNWRDNKGLQVAPSVIKNASLAFSSDKPVKSIWMASPDLAGGSSFELSFVQSDDKVRFIVPYLKYWDMIVVEY